MGRHSKLKMRRKISGDVSKDISALRDKYSPLGEVFLSADEFLAAKIDPCSLPRQIVLHFLRFDDFFRQDIIDWIVQSSRDSFYRVTISSCWSDCVCGFYNAKHGLFGDSPCIVESKKDRDAVDGVKSLFSIEEECNAMIALSPWERIATANQISKKGLKTLVLLWTDPDHYGFLLDEETVQGLLSESSYLRTLHHYVIQDPKRQSILLIYVGADFETSGVILNPSEDYSFLSDDENPAFLALNNGDPIYKKQKDAALHLVGCKS